MIRTLLTAQYQNTRLVYHEFLTLFLRELVGTGLSATASITSIDSATISIMAELSPNASFTGDPVAVAQSALNRALANAPANTSPAPTTGNATSQTINLADMTNPAVPVVDFSKGTLISLPLTASVTTVTVLNPSTGTYTFQIAQPSSGGCSFAWPAFIKGAGQISNEAGTADPNTVSTQSFAYNSNTGTAYPVSLLITESA